MPVVDAAAAASALLAGEVVAVPTDTVYGLAALAARPGGPRRIFALKRRPEVVALPVLVGAPEDALALVDPRDRESLRLLGELFWPGPLTLVVRRDPASLLQLGGDPSTIGLRCPGHVGLRALCTEVGPLAVTSANRHREHPCTTAAEVLERLGAVPVLDGGRCDAPPSTVVALDGREARQLRAGSVAVEDVARALARS